MRYGHVWFGRAGRASPGVVSCAVDGSGVGLAGEVRSCEFGIGWVRKGKAWLARLGVVVRVMVS